jgi:hypothetical protein
MFDEIFTVDEIVALLRYDAASVREGRRRVYEMVRDGRLRPIGGVPAGRLGSSLRFTRTAVNELMEGASA